MSRVTMSIVGILILGVVLAAQNAAPPQAPAAPQFKSSTDLVRLDVSVLDKNRRPVRGLTAADFVVLENGKPQTVAAFSAVNVPDVTAPTAPWLRDVASDVRDNADVQQRRLFIIAIDDATIENDLAAIKAVKEIAQGIINRLGPADLASVVFTRDNRNSQDFTSDRTRLMKAVDGFTLGFRGQAPAVAASDDLWFLYSVGVLDRAVEFLADVADRRKAIIYIGQGIPFDVTGAVGSFNATPDAPAGGASAAALQSRIKDQMNDIFERAQRANVTIYAADPCGLRKPPVRPPPGARAVPATCVSGNEVEYIENIANSTGGRAIVNTTDFAAGLDAVFQENASYYLLGFQPADTTKDGTFRKVEVKVNRPDVEVRTRSGYDAPREESALRTKAAVNPLVKALSGVVPKGDLPMQMTGAPFAYVGSPIADSPAVDAANPAQPEVKNEADKKAKNKKADGPKPEASVLIAVGFKQPIRQSDQRIVEDVDLQVTALNADGRSFGNFRHRAGVTIRPGSTGMAEYEVFGQIDLKPGRYQLRIAANLESFADSGSVYYDVEVPDFANEPLSMSGLLLSSTPARQYAPKNGLKPTVSVVPTTRRVFSAAHTVAAFVRVYQGRKAKVLPVSARMTVRDATDAIIVDRKQDLAANEFIGEARAADLQLNVPIADLPTGDYLLTIETKAGSSVIKRECRFTVVK